jgi:hypothetical protein
VVLGNLGAKQIATGPGLRLAGRPRSGAKAEASEADETNVDPMVTPPLPWRMKLPEGLDGLRQSPVARPGFCFGLR